MKKKIAISFMIMALVMALAGGATFAYFTDKDTNEKATITAGTLNIDFMPDGISFFGIPIYDGDDAATFDISKIKPGDVGTAKVSVHNVGNLPAQVLLTATGSEALFQGSNPVVISGLPTTWTVMQPGETKEFSCTVTFPAAAGNSYQGASGKIQFSAKATQTNVVDPGSIAYPDPEIWP